MVRATGSFAKDKNSAANDHRFRSSGRLGSLVNNRESDQSAVFEFQQAVTGGI